MRKSTWVILLWLTLTGCDKYFGAAGSPPYLKTSLLELCGETDQACVEAVNTQFETCHQKNISPWDLYMQASSSKQDQYLDLYSKNIYACITDTSGKAFFEFIP